MNCVFNHTHLFIDSVTNHHLLHHLWYTIKCSCNFFEIKKNDACFSEFVPIAYTNYGKITQISSKENLSQKCQVMKVSNHIKVMCHYRSREWMMSLNTSNELFDKKIPKIQIISFAKLNDVTKLKNYIRMNFYIL